MSDILDRARTMAVARRKPKEDPSKKFKELLIDICSQDGGVELFRHLRQVCFFGETPNITASNNEIVFVLGRQSVYNDIRKFLPKKARERVEQQIKEGE